MKNGKLRRHEVAQRCGVSPTTIDRWRRAGKITPLPHPIGPGRGRIVYYDWASVKKALKIKP